MGIALKIKRAETPFYAGLKRLALSLVHFDLSFWRPWGHVFDKAELRIGDRDDWRDIRGENGKCIGE